MSCLRETHLTIVYWRFDEGKGNTLENLTKAELTGEIDALNEAEADGLWTALDDADPMEFEDKWGKKCPVQYAISMQAEATSIKCAKKNWFGSSLNEFTLELWLKPQNSNGTIMEIGQGNQTSSE